MKKIREYTNGNHIFMELELNGRTEKIDVYYDKNGTASYKTTADAPDNNYTVFQAERRAAIIDAFNKLY